VYSSFGFVSYSEHEAPQYLFWCSMGNMIFPTLYTFCVIQMFIKPYQIPYLIYRTKKPNQFNQAFQRIKLHQKMRSNIWFTVVALCSTLIQGLPQVFVSRTVIGDPGSPGFTFSIPDIPTISRTIIEGPSYTIPTDLPTTSTSKKPTTTSKTSTSKPSECLPFED